MRRVIFFILIVFSLSSCVGMIYSNSSYGSKVTGGKGNATAKVQYKSLNYLANETNEKAANEMWLASRKEKKLQNLPQGGELYIKIYGWSIDAANTKHWTYIVQDMDGNEIIRKHGPNRIPEYSVSELGTSWWNFDILKLEKLVSIPFKVYIVDEFNSKKIEYTIYPNYSSQ